MFEFLNYQFVEGGLRIIHLLIGIPVIILLCLDWGERAKIRDEHRRMRDLHTHRRYGR